MKKIAFILLLVSQLFNAVIAQITYFPPNNNATWETINPQTLGWKNDKINELYTYLDQTNSKAFIVLKDGKIVLEKYFGKFGKDSLSYWASAGKSMTSSLVGIAAAEGKLNLNDVTSKHLGKGWTSLSAAQEDKISIRHQLTMTTGLDDGVVDSDCTLPNCLVFNADAGSRWAYHNGPYTLLDKVIEKATGLTFNQYYNQKIRNRIGMDGGFFKKDYNNINYSTARSFARYGLLVLNKGKWNNEQIIPAAFLSDATATSQQLNKSYGYLWWLNGKASHMIPSLQIVFSNMLSPNAPIDMFAAMGKNGQILSVVPSQNLVVIRMGQSDGSPVPTTYSNEIWKRLALVLPATAISDIDNTTSIDLYPNPSDDVLYYEAPTTAEVKPQGVYSIIFHLDNHKKIVKKFVKI
jgi:CubicO group peptidase (beta-lactamase class C family)